MVEKFHFEQLSSILAEINQKYVLLFWQRFKFLSVETMFT